jgi:hypothetical protein
MPNTLKQPRGLGNAGRSLWTSVLKAVPPNMELDEREQALLTLAAKQADDNAALEAAVAKQGRTVAGSRGQARVHPAIAELRNGRAAVAKLLKQLDLKAPAVPVNTSEFGRQMANRRWHPNPDEQPTRRRRTTHAS